jgi:DNA polymerase-3 subunit epsilon
MLERLLRSVAPGARDEAARWVVVDTETTGLDPSRDRLLAIGGVAVDGNGIRIGDSFEVVVRHTDATDAHNIAIHGIGRETLGAGVPLPDALAAFARWVDGAPLCAFHADFDRRVLDRAASRAGVPRIGVRWLDLAPLAHALRPDVPRKGTGTLDEWLEAYGLDCACRHNAACDAWASAELLLVLRAAAARQGVAGFEALVALGRQHRWLAPHR